MKTGGSTSYAVYEGLSCNVCITAKFTGSQFTIETVVVMRCLHIIILLIHCVSYVRMYIHRSGTHGCVLL